MRTSSHFLDGTRDILLLTFVALVVGWWVLVHRPASEDTTYSADFATFAPGDTP